MKQAQKQRQRRSDAEIAEEAPTPEVYDLAPIDNLLEEVDLLLEEMGQDFAAQYVQRGGQ